MTSRQRRRACALLIAAVAGCAPQRWSGPVYSLNDPKAPPRTSTWLLPNIINVDRCATVPPGAVPQPNGTFARGWQHAMAAAAAEDDFVVYLHEWTQGGENLGPYGKYHVAEIGKRLPDVPFAVVVQPGPNDALNMMRRQLIVQYLSDHGIADAEQRVVLALPRAEGLLGIEAVTIFQQQRGTFGSQTGSGGVNGGGGNFGGGIGTPFLGTGGGYPGGLGGGIGTTFY